ncbi:glycoside hydrolase family 76 protein [Arthrobacter sp. Y-9]|uniref:glycoside hydrolase family 76 protein n=1 Tax=Arthrobacter sp. Y-9 TaxID=3039385 RepID=UPI00241E90E6|nr:glycoside hydrolase family 76 protein [Arthrobacter sp. Y-9]WFR84524.1 glycoside hydrolase family 76 protein [Arthrobacter sp. Y-9]
MDAQQRAAEAARSVIARHGRRLAGLPGTHLGRIKAPSRAFSELGVWHYWWQAHYVDALVDAALREQDPDGRKAALARRVIRSIRLHNVFRYVNSYTDDMAWLALAAQRLQALDPGARHARGLDALQRTLNRRLVLASTDELGGGSFWSSARDFKNTPATAPVSLYFARSGDTVRARALVEWLRERLLDPDTGLFLDGIHLQPDGSTTVAREVYSYNQGPVLGSYLELGTPDDLRHAEELIQAVADRLTHPGGALQTHGPGDGALFTGILARYLALAARDERLAPTARSTASALVTTTADAFWAGRQDSGEGWVFPRETAGAHDPDRLDGASPPDGASLLNGTVEFAAQLQAWMTLEAAASLTPARQVRS